MLREQGRDVHGEFLQLLPQQPRPIRIQRWSARQVGLLLLMVPVAMLLVLTCRFVLFNNDETTTLLGVQNLGCDQLEPLLLQAQSVPSASLCPACGRCQRAGDSSPPPRGPGHQRPGTAGRCSPWPTTWSVPGWSSSSVGPATPPGRPRSPLTNLGRNAMSGSSPPAPGLRPPGTPCSQAAVSPPSSTRPANPTPPSPIRRHPSLASALGRCSGRNSSSAQMDAPPRPPARLARRMMHTPA
jgi:hypothetical protein